MSRWASAVIRAIDANDVLIGLGLLCVGAGLALWSVALALAVVGLLLFALGVWPFVAPRPPRGEG
jgi:hypothetical protein